MQGYNFNVLSAMDNSQAIAGVSEAPPPTPLSAALEKRGAGAEDRVAGELTVHCGARTPRLFDDLSHEMDSLLLAAAIVDLGWRAKILVQGKDRVRWLNGMLTNTVKGLPQGEGNYSFVLNAQGRIQGDCYAYQRAEDIVLDTSRNQVPTLLRHLEHYIIMDEVEIEEVSDRWTALALIGPKAPEILAGLDVTPPPPIAPSVPLGNAHLSRASIHEANGQEIEVIVVAAYQVLVPRYELWFSPAETLPVWRALKKAGAVPAGLEAAETLRVLEGTPLYGIDLNERDLPQEANQVRALNFSKGCYLGQEIVERIRSRGKVHRQFRQFTLDGSVAPAPFDLHRADQTVGQITSAASLLTPGFSGNFALGYIREESLESQSPIQYEGGIAIPLEAPPRLPAS